MEFASVITIFVSIFAICNPIGLISFFVALTEGYKQEEKIKVIKKIILVATVTLIVFGIIGQYIFTLFSITIPAFRIAGGLLILKIGFDMIQGGRPKAKRTDDEKQEALEREAIGIVPLGIPMFAGPGAISTVMLYVAHSQPTLMENALQLSIVFASVFLTMGIAYVFLKNANRIFDRIGRMGTLAISRIMGLILTAMAIQFLIAGVHSVLLSWNVI
jgi:multiple antibiotic resistance protein